MPTTTYKKPTIEEFAKVLKATDGNLTAAATVIKCDRSTIREWANNDPEFQKTIDNSRRGLLDQCIQTAKTVAMGIPLRENGQITGWVSPPDPGMLRYFMSTLGRDEGFGDKLDITSDGKSIAPIQIEVITSRDQVRKEEND